MVKPMRTGLGQRGLLAIALGAMGIWLAVDRLRWLPPDPEYLVKVRGAAIMRQGLEVLREERERRGLPWDLSSDPNRTGLIGRAYSDLTTTSGFLPAKRTATNPNMAGLVVELLQEAGVRSGDSVAAVFSGSFPGWNLAVLSAGRAMKLRLAIISSVGASSYGANEPEWSWPEMERVLAEHGVIVHRSARVALGGIIDEHGGLDGTGLEVGAEAIRRSGGHFLDEGGRATLERDVQRRMEFLLAACGGKPSAFVNVGGALTSLGGTSDSRLYPGGLIRHLAPSSDPRRGLIARMVEREVPVVHLLDARHLAARYGLPFDPVPLPAGPHGTVMRPRRFGPWLAWGGLVVLGLAAVVVARRGRTAPRTHSNPESDCRTQVET